MLRTSALTLTIIALLSNPSLGASAIERNEYPPLSEVPKNSRLLSKHALRIAYSKTHKQAEWVSYLLSPERLRSCVPRKNKFKADPELSPDEASTLSDYQGTGFDRGHLSPAADQRWSAQAMDDSFLLSNIAPQPPQFNQRIWATLENLVRAWALQSTQLWVITGPQLNTIEGSIGKNQVSISSYFYKALVGFSDSKVSRAIAFRLANTETQLSRQSSIDTLRDSTLSIDELEKFTEIDFLNELSDDVQETIETQWSPEAWDFKAQYKPLPCHYGFESFGILGSDFIGEI